MHLANQGVAARFPKSRFAMQSVYSFTAASVLTSIIFSLLLFISIDDDPVMQIMFASLAIIFELGKFFVWYEVGERIAGRRYLAAGAALLFYLVLAAISIAGSVGGINSATNKSQDEARAHENQIAAYNRQIAAIEQQVTLNNEAAQKYIELNRIALGLSRIQKENSALRQKQLELAMERDNLPVARQGSVLGLIDGIAVALKLDSGTAQLALVVFLSVLLDFFAAFFISLIGEEHRFRQQYKLQMAESESQTVHEMPKLLTYQAGDSHLEAVSDQQAFVPCHPEYERVVQGLKAGQLRCSKKAIAGAFDLSSEDVELLFSQMLSEGLVSQKANKHYRWEGGVQPS